MRLRASQVGVFPGPRFDDPEGLDATEADIELLGWEDCAENLSAAGARVAGQRPILNRRRVHPALDQ